MQRSDRPTVLTEDSVVVTIVERVADEKGVDPIELPPLDQQIDTDALESLCTSSETETIVFAYCGYTIEVVDSGEIRFLANGGT